MNILHIYRGYGNLLSNPVIDNQIHSLRRITNININRFILKKGGFNYFREVINLHRFLKNNEVDVIHAHYSFSGFLAILAFSGKPVLCSLMGSDVLADNHYKRIIKFFIKKKWVKTIVKSKEMQTVFPDSVIIPNGVDFENFLPKNIEDAYIRTGFDRNKINIIFIATNPLAKVKNIELAKKAIKHINNDRIILHQLSSISFEDLPYYYSCADLLLLTSLSEGSPNIIKEAMACNCPIVSTDVGDVRSIIEGTDGCFLTSFDAYDVANNIKKAIGFGKITKGRERIKHLDSNIISKKLLKLYHNCIEC